MSLELDKGQIHETVLNLISEERRGLLLDAGAGNDALSLELHKLGFKVIAADINNNFKARDVENGIEFALCDLDKVFPFEDDTFDYVVAVEVIEHLENLWHFLREINRVLKKEEKLYLTTPNVHSLHQRIYFLFSKPFYSFSDEEIKIPGKKSESTKVLFIW